MMSAADCRAKACEALEKLGRMADPKLIDLVRAHAADWMALAHIAERQDALKRRPAAR